MIQSLITAGHPLPDILGYTLDQVQWWTAAVDRQSDAASVRSVINARLAIGADVTGLLRALGGL